MASKDGFTPRITCEGDTFSLFLERIPLVNLSPAIRRIVGDLLTLVKLEQFYSSLLSLSSESEEQAELRRVVKPQAWLDSPTS